jgi:uncharacterized protein
MTPRGTHAGSEWARRVEQGDWDSIAAEANEFGGALLPQLLTDDESTDLRALYERGELFRSTVNMGRHRFGEGEYRYLDMPYPEPVEQLKQALYPRLLPIARDWWTKLGRPTPWPDTLDEWLDICHQGGRRSRPRSCSNTPKAIGTRCTVTSTASSCSHSRS